MGRRLRMTQRGGARLGRGVSGIVYSPPLLCANENPLYKGKGFASKVVPDSMLESQIKNSAEIHALDPDGLYTIVPLHHCQLAPHQTNTNFRRNRIDPKNTYNNVSSNNTRRGQKKIYTHQIIYRNGGQNLHRLLVSPKNFSKVFAALKVFMPNLVEFNRHYIHFDLHLENLVFDGKRIRMIDFEKMDRATRPELATADICNFLPQIYRRLMRYSSEEGKCDTTYRAWLKRHTYLEDYEVCRDGSVEALVVCVNELPVATPKSSGCTIMG
jgi:hypothetical protein